jgi:hypothetical protein
MNIQLNELSNGNKASDSLNRYNLGSKKKDGKSDVPDKPPIEDKPSKDVTSNNREINPKIPHQ